MAKKQINIPRLFAKGLFGNDIVGILTRYDPVTLKSDLYRGVADLPAEVLRRRIITRLKAKGKIVE